MSWLLLAQICGGLTMLTLGMLAWLFWTDPARGLAQTTHRVEMLPRVLADRYTAFAILGLVFALYGDPLVLAAFFAVCALMGFADGWLYARAGHPHMKHTISGVASVVALAISLAALMFEKGL